MLHGYGIWDKVLTAKLWGMNDKAALKKAVTIMLRFCFVIGRLHWADYY
jgi:hypothetical protein